MIGELSFPNLPPNQWYMVDLFLSLNFNLRGSAYRSDAVTPLGPNKVLIEFRGYGLKKIHQKKDKLALNTITLFGSFW